MRMSRYSAAALCLISSPSPVKRPWEVLNSDIVDEPPSHFPAPDNVNCIVGVDKPDDSTLSAGRETHAAIMLRLLTPRG